MMLRNKRVLSIFLSIALVLGILMGGAPKVAFAEEGKTLTIVHMNDVHGRLLPDDREGGMGFGRFKTKLDELKAENPNFLLLNAGDTLHGTTLINVTEGETMVNLMNLVGFDAMTPGNHDFNYGTERLLELKSMAEFPILGSNILKEADGTSDFDPYVIKEFDGFKVGVFGLGTEETKYKSHPNNTIGIKFEDPIAVAEKMVKELKEKEVDVIVALVHLGIEGSLETTSKELAEKVKGIDLIIDGHSHEELNMVVGDALLVQAGYYMRNIGVVELEIVDGKVSKKTASLISSEDTKDLTPNPEIEDEIKKIEEINKPIVDVVVGKAKVDLLGERADVRTGETNLGNLITDAMLKSTGADVAFTNGGGIRASIPAGEVKIQHILTSFPFTNTLAVIEVTGAEIKDALEHGVDLYPEQAGHFPHVSGMIYKFDEGKPVGERIVEVLVKGQPLVADKKYKLVTNDFMASGGDGYTMFSGRPFLAEGGLLSDVLMEHFKEVGEVEPKVEGRVVAVPKVEEKVEEKYVVKQDDVLWKIAKLFNTTWEKLAELNNLKNPHLIFPGQVILIP